jgi:chromosome segregation ATPase
MRYWFTPFLTSAPVCSILSDAGLQRWLEHESTPPEADCLLLYDSPDQLISLAGAAPDFQKVTALSLLAGFRRLLELSEHSGQPVLAISQLQWLDSHGLCTWLEGGDIVTPSPVSPLPIPPLVASVVLSILEAQPALLDCYYDLELRAVLLGRDPDLRYSERLQLSAQDAELLLQAFLVSLRVEAAAPVLEQRLSTLHAELVEVKEEAEKSLTSLHQVQEDREHYFMADSEKQRQLLARDRELEELRLSNAAQLSAHEQELKVLRERLEPQLAELEQRLSSKDTELHEVRKASELTLLQLHQVQKELEHYSLATSEKQQQLEVQDRELEELRLSSSAQFSAHEQKLKVLRDRLEPQLAELEQHLFSRDTELHEVREAAELTLLQLHQVQEQLEHYSLATAEKQQQLEVQDRELEGLRLSNAAQLSAHEQELKVLRDRFELQVSELEQRLSNKQTELHEVREASEFTLLQLHQVQEQLEHFFLDNGEKQQQLEARDREFETLRQLFEPRLAELEDCLASRESELQVVSEAAERSLLQLHQVQEVLEHCFLKARASDQLAQAQYEQLQRAQRLIVRLQPDVIHPIPYSSTLSVQVWPAVAAAMPKPTLETEALLGTYAESLQRARAILERARGL